MSREPPVRYIELPDIAELPSVSSTVSPLSVHTKSTVVHLWIVRLVSAYLLHALIAILHSNWSLIMFSIGLL